MSPDQAIDWNTELYVRDAGFVPALGHAVLDWLDAKAGERILDLGCGDGALTEALGSSGADVLGIDASPSQVAAAGARGLDVRLMDATRMSFDGEFDAVFSNAALHWIKDRGAMLDGVARALKPGGRFVAEMGGDGNVACIIAAILAALAERGVDGRAASPWLFPGPEDQAAALRRAGFRVARMEHFDRPTDLECSMSDWLEIFAPAFAGLIPAEERAAFFADVSERLAPVLFDSDRGVWWVDYVRLRFEAVKP